MTDISRESEEGISLLGNQHTQYPTDYDPSVLETFLNKHPKTTILLSSTVRNLRVFALLRGNLILPPFISPMFRASAWWKARA